VEQDKSEHTGCLALVPAEAIRVEGCLRRLTPLLLLLLRRSTATITTSAAWLLHLLLVRHARVTKGLLRLLLLRKWLSPGAGSCPRIRLLVSILQLPPVPLT
jgi:hypothetical protein